MYGKNFWDRVSLSQIASFLMEGTELVGMNEDLAGQSLEERGFLYESQLLNGLSKYEERVKRHYHHGPIDADDVELGVFDDFLFGEIFNSVEKTNHLAFEVGMLAGIQLYKEILNAQPSNSLVS